MRGTAAVPTGSCMELDPGKPLAHPTLLRQWGAWLVRQADKPGALLQDVPHIDVPRSIPALSTRRVLVMTFLQGTPINRLEQVGLPALCKNSCLNTHHQIQTRPPDVQTQVLPATLPCAGPAAYSRI